MSPIVDVPQKTAQGFRLEKQHLFSTQGWPNWLLRQHANNEGTGVVMGNGCLRVLATGANARPGDWIVLDGDGDLLVMTDETFRLFYYEKKK